MNGADKATLRQCWIDLDSIWDGVIVILEREEGDTDDAYALAETTHGIYQAVIEIEDLLGIEAD